MLILIVFGIDGVVVMWKCAHDRPSTWCNPSNRLWLSNKAKPEPFGELSSTFWRLGPSYTCLALLVISAPNRSWVVAESCLHHGQIIQGFRHLLLRCWCSWCRAGNESSPKERSARVFKRKPSFLDVNQSNHTNYDDDYLSHRIHHVSSTLNTVSLYDAVHIMMH